jgi:hypothetical protein
VNATDCWAVGSSSDTNGEDQALVEQNTGSGWGVVSAPTPSGGGQLNGVTCVSADECWAVGGGMIEQYKGSGWSVVQNSAPPGSDLWGVTCASVDDCWAVGFDADSLPPAVLLHNAGSGWRVGSIPNAADSSLEGVTCVTTDDCWAVGWSDIGFGTSSFHTQSLVEHGT